jgi:hypothetical protein
MSPVCAAIFKVNISIPKGRNSGFERVGIYVDE